VSLYEPGVVFVSPSGETLVGRDQIRQVLAGLMEKKARFESHIVRAVTVADIAVLYTNFQGTVMEAPDKLVRFSPMPLKCCDARATVHGS
jgi:SnoaL-like domain